MQGDSALGRALGLVRELRQRCPWDRAQTPQTLRPYLVEEALELDHAIQTDDPEAMRDELGDMLLHLAFQIVIAEERSQFNAEVVTHTLEEKMWRRQARHTRGPAADLTSSPHGVSASGARCGNRVRLAGYQRSDGESEGGDRGARAGNGKRETRKDRGRNR